MHQTDAYGDSQMIALIFLVPIAIVAFGIVSLFLPEG